MQRGTDDEFAHVRAGGDPLELVHHLSGIIRARSDRDGGERIQAVRMHPEVRVRDPHRPLGGIAEAFERERELAARLVNQPDGTRRQRLPARVAETASERESMLETLARRAWGADEGTGRRVGSWT